MKPGLCILILSILFWGVEAPVLSASVDAAVCSSEAPQERVIEGPGEDESDAREFDLDESDFQHADNSDPQGRKKIELFLGISFLIAVIVGALLLKGRKSS